MPDSLQSQQIAMVPKYIHSAQLH